jgi:hypothetical protein
MYRTIIRKGLLPFYFHVPKHLYFRGRWKLRAQIKKRAGLPGKF